MIITAMDAEVRHPQHPGLLRVAIASATTLAAVNVWTGAPLLAVWVGSRVQGGGGLSMGTLFAMVGVLAVVEFGLLVVLTRLSDSYDEITGRDVGHRRTSPWLRSMRGERDEVERGRVGVSAVERIVAISVAAAAVTFEIWFFFFAGSPI